MAEFSFFWHDYESFGIDPARDRPAQFAGVRTDAELNPIAEPVVWYCQPALDYLPQPQACAITGITPQQAWIQGLPEAEFIARVEQELGHPGTCGVGYNSLRFDDEVTRHSLYRNLRDPYRREWSQGCSRWDVLDMLRLVHVLKPDTLNWPQQDGQTSFRLERLSAANGIEHSHAHDALSDVWATLGLAKLVKERQPELFAYCLALRQKQQVLAMIDYRALKPLLHVSGRFPGSRLHSAVVVPLLPQPGNNNAVVLWDLSQPAAMLAELEVDELRRRLYTPKDQLAEDELRPGLKSLHINRSPMLLGVNKSVLSRLQLDEAELKDNLAWLRQHRQLWQPKLQQLYQQASELERPSDPDLLLYSGGFLPDSDRRILQQIIVSEVSQLKQSWPFQDGRLEEMLFRYRGRNYPTSLDQQEQSQWLAHCRERLLDGRAEALTLQDFRQQLQQLADSNELAVELQEALAKYAEQLEQYLQDGNWPAFMLADSRASGDR